MAEAGNSTEAVSAALHKARLARQGSQATANVRQSSTCASQVSTQVLNPETCPTLRTNPGKGPNHKCDRREAEWARQAALWLWFCPF